MTLVGLFLGFSVLFGLEFDTIVTCHSRLLRRSNVASSDTMSWWQIPG